MILNVSAIDNFDFEFIAPPSKSYTHRAIIIAGLSYGISNICNPLISEDTLASLNAVEEIGCKIKRTKDKVTIEGIGTLNNGINFKDNIGTIDLANSGTSLRILTSVFSLSSNLILTGDSSLKTRPMKDLIEALERLGAEFDFLNEEYKAPFLIKGGFNGGETYISGSTSSQFISSLLIAAPLSENGLELEITDSFVSKPYVDITLDVMRNFNVDADYCGNTFKVFKQKYIANDYTVEGDYSSASYFLSLPGVVGGKIKVLNLLKDSKQGDKIILDILSKMGLKVNSYYDYVEVEGDGELNGIAVDLSSAPDLLPTVAVLGAMANGETKITGVKHARFKETDRIKTTCEELIKLSCDVKELDDGMIIKGKSYKLNKNVLIDSHGDHRLAMAFTLFGLKHGIAIDNAEVFDISFPEFKNLIERLS